MIYLGVGSNEGDRWAALVQGYRELAAAGVRVARASPVYETAPWGVADQPPYLNAVWEVETTFSPAELLSVCQAIERRLGRPQQNRMRWGPRVLDLDLLAYGEVVCETPELTLPHPWIPHRPFVLGPWKDLAPYFYLVPWEKKRSGSSGGGGLALRGELLSSHPPPLHNQLPPIASPQTLSAPPEPSKRAFPSLRSATLPPP
jgi:2-amino-4-hydroxy-6-hydroxymethyldihydropteridine diphosphokinase